MLVEVELGGGAATVGVVAGGDGVEGLGLTGGGVLGLKLLGETEGDVDQGLTEGVDQGLAEGVDQPGFAPKLPPPPPPFQLNPFVP